jgi:hypothetical protein
MVFENVTGCTSRGSLTYAKLKVPSQVRSVMSRIVTVPSLLTCTAARSSGLLHRFYPGAIQIQIILVEFLSALRA